MALRRTPVRPGPRPARRVFVAAVALSMGLLSGCAESLFFHPDSQVYTTPQAMGVAAIDLYIDGPDGSRLHAWWLPATGTPRGTVLHLHGNAANISNHLPLVAWLPAEGYNVLSMDYRGFGQSTGSPSLDGVVADARAALNYLRQRPGVDAQRLAVLGQSLGGATAVRAVAADGSGVRLLILDSAFSSYRGIARENAGTAGVIGWLAPLLLPTLPGADHDPLQAATRLGQQPLLVIHGSADRLIGPHHGQALYQAAPGPKQWLPVQGGHHIDALTRPDVRRQVLASLGAALP